MSESVESLRARIEILEAQVEELTRHVAVLVASAGAVEPAVEPDAVWQRLGLTEGERRTVTVLFADVTGFTALSEALDPEAMQLVMRDTMALLAGCVAAEGGTLEKFIGDALCAIFGAPVAHVDEPERAARAALAMHEALAERAAARPDQPALGVHVGINTGPVIAGAVGDGSQFGVMGDTINTAARLMGLAGDGQTFVSAATARRLRRSFRLDDAGLHEVKGKAEPLVVSSLTGALSTEEQAGQHRLRAPLVGRDEELRTLRNLAARAASGEGAVALLVGEAGSGVSRLGHEVASELGEQGWRVLRSSARVHAETPLGLVATALGPLLEGGAGDQRAELTDALLAGGVAAPHDFELSLGELVVDASRTAPIAVLLDDIDGADPGSVEVVRYLTRATAGASVLWVLTGERMPAPFAAAAEGDAVLLRIAPLPDAAMADLLEGLLPGALPTPARDRLGHLAEGNVQFAVEIAHALVDDGVVVESEPGRYVLVGDPALVSLPGSVAELVEARIDQLATQARITLQDAAVIGQRFSPRLLQRVATIPASFEAALSELADAELILPPGDDDEVGEGDDLWSFRSRMVREVAYDSILRRRRPALHRAVADALVELEADRIADNADLLAHHYEESDDPPLAMPHLVDAIERAEVAYNFTGALERAKRAIRLRDRFPGRIDDDVEAAVLQRLGIMKLVLGDPSGLADLEAAVDLLAAVGRPAEVASLLERVGWYLTVSGDRTAAVPYLQAAQERAETELDGPARAATLAGVATSRALAVAASGDLLTGVAAVDGAAAEAAEASDAFTEARALMVGGVCQLWAGDPHAAQGQLRAALELAWANVYGTLADRCGRWLVQALVDADRGDEAEALAEPLLARSDDRGDPSVGCGVRAALAALALQQGDPARARALAEAALNRATERHIATDAAAEAHLLLAQVTLAEASASAASTAADEVADQIVGHLADLAALVGEDGWLAWRWNARAALIRGELALARHDADGAREAAAEARIALGRAPARRELEAADRLDERAAGYPS